MIVVQPEQALTLAAIVSEGTFDAAAARLRLTPSAVSQRVRALEVAVGRPVLRRVRPVELTAAGEAVVRFARQLELLTCDLRDQLRPGSEASMPRVTVVVNGDSLHTWALPGLVRAGARGQLTVLREDQDHSLELLRRGVAHGAVTAVAAAVPGCTAQPLGILRYRPVCSPEFAGRWFADGVSADALAAAPVVVYDDRDDLQDRYLRRRRSTLDPPRHQVPATAEFGQAIALGLGWGMLPDLQLAGYPAEALQPLPGAPQLDVPLYWQQWRLTSMALDAVATALRDAARTLIPVPGQR